MKTASEQVDLYTARAIIVNADSWLENAVLAVKSGRIAGVFPQSYLAVNQQQFDTYVLNQDYADCIISPGFINLHTHLDYSALGGLLSASSDLFDWIPQLMKHSSAWTAGQWLDSARIGVEQSLAAGTTCVVDSSYAGAAAIACSERGLRGLVGLELFGLDESKAKDTWNRWLVKRESLIGNHACLQAALESGLVQLTVAPHAPYTVCPGLLKYSFEFACHSGLPALMHLAETAAENCWYAGGAPVIDSFLQKAFGDVLDFEDGPGLEWVRRSESVSQVLLSSGLARSRLIAAHCVHLLPQDREQMCWQNVSIAHCPRSNARLGNGLAPLADLCPADVAVGLGTDSLASCDSLSLLDEAKSAFYMHKAASPGYSLESKELFNMITGAAARALGWESEIGSLESGKLADFVVFSAPKSLLSGLLKPIEAIMWERLPILATFVSGKKVWAGTRMFRLGQ